VGLAAPLVVSADSHVTEPADLWYLGLGPAWRDRAPRVVRDFGTDRMLFVAPGVTPFPIATGFGAGREGQDLKRHLHRGYEAARPGGWDPVARLRDQDADGVGCEVLYPTHTMRLFELPDAELQRACFQRYNDWILEFAAYAPDRLRPLAVISLYDVERAVRELERVAAIGAAGALIWGSPPDTAAPYGSPAYDPFWATASSLGLPVSLHCITSAQPKVHSSSAYVQYFDVIHDVQRSLAEMVCGGVLERFPSLIVVSAENDCGWIPHFQFRLDHAHDRFGRYATRPLPMPPSEYVRRQVYATFQEDHVLSYLDDSFFADRCMWASDYPHNDSTWPDSRAHIAKSLGSPEDPRVAKLIAGNASRIYLRDSVGTSDRTETLDRERWPDDALR
jgi:uncharacterized protein